MSHRARLAPVVMMLLLLGVTAFAADPADTCQASKLLRAGAYDLCLLKATARAVKRGDAAPDLSKCDEKFALAWAKIEAKAGGACPTTGDATAIGSQVQGDVAAIIGALTPTTSTTTTSTTLPVPCGGAEYPGCGGPCPAGSSCWATVTAGPTTACTCLPAVLTPCADTGGSVATPGGVCGGVCPVGEVCSTLYVDEASLSATCGCMPAGATACLSFDDPVCGGSCPAGMTCAADILFACACQ